jgi:large subunit ribosomal protein L6
MSRIGKKPITVPGKVEVSIDKTTITVKGPKGQLQRDLHPDMAVRIDEGTLVVERPTDLRHHRALHGLTRALVANMVEGVSQGYRRTLLIEGVGYQAAMRGDDLELKLGLSHELVIPAPDNITFEVPKDSRGRVVHIDGIDKEAVGQIAADIRGWRPPEPYKGKGIRYENEIIIRKAGKTGKKK